MQKWHPTSTSKHMWRPQRELFVQTFQPLQLFVTPVEQISLWDWMLVANGVFISLRTWMRMYPSTAKRYVVSAFWLAVCACRGLRATLVQLIRGQRIPLMVTLSLPLLASHIPGGGQWPPVGYWALEDWTLGSFPWRRIEQIYTLRFSGFFPTAKFFFSHNMIDMFCSSRRSTRQNSPFFHWLLII